MQNRIVTLGFVLSFVLMQFAPLVLQAQAFPTVAQERETIASVSTMTLATNVPLLYWPLDSSHRTITSYPNTAWTWNHLGLNPGKACPPFHIRYLSTSLDYWRDYSIPEAQDRAQADPGNIGKVGCYSKGTGSNWDHEGTDIAAALGTPVYAVADGTVHSTSDGGDNSRITINHSRTVNGQTHTWQVRYVHVRNNFPIRSGAVQQGQVIAYTGNQFHLHVEVEDPAGNCVGTCITNPWENNIWIDNNGDGYPDTTQEAANPSGDEYEPDNLFTQATTLQTNGTAQRHSIHTGGDEDWFQFHADAGARYTIETFDLAGSADTFMGLFWNNNGHPHLYTSNDDGGTGVASRIEYTFEQSGTYYVKVRDYYHPNRGAEDRQYSIRINKQATNLCNYQVPVEASQRNHNLYMYVQYHETSGWNGWNYKGRYQHSRTEIAVQPRVTGQYHHYMIAIYNTNDAWDFFYAIVSTQNGCNALTTWRYYWNGSSWIYQGANAAGVAPSTLLGDPAPPGGGPSIPVESVELKSATTTVQVNQTLEIEAMIAPAEGAVESITWDPEPLTGQGELVATFSWTEPGDAKVLITVDPVSGENVVAALDLVIEPAPVAITAVTIDGPAEGTLDQAHTFTAPVQPTTASAPIAYTWIPEPQNGQGTANATYVWDASGIQTVQVTASNSEGSATASHVIEIAAPAAVAITSATIRGPQSGTTNESYTFAAEVNPANATTPIVYTWLPAPQQGQGTAEATYRWDEPGVVTIEITVSNDDERTVLTEQHLVTIEAPTAIDDLVEPEEPTTQKLFLPIVINR